MGEKKRRQKAGTYMSVGSDGYGQIKIDDFLVTAISSEEMFGGKKAIRLNWLEYIARNAKDRDDIGSLTLCAFVYLAASDCEDEARESMAKHAMECRTHTVPFLDIRVEERPERAALLFAESFKEQVPDVRRNDQTRRAFWFAAIDKSLKSVRTPWEIGIYGVTEALHICATIADRDNAAALFQQAASLRAVR